jgi:hypothetical protein
VIVVVILIQNVFMKARENTPTLVRNLTLLGFERSVHLHEHLDTSTKDFMITIKTIKL